MATLSAIGRSLLDRDLRLDRIRDETFGVREMMHLIEFLFGWLFLAGKLELRMQLHPRDRQFAVLVLLHVADRFIDIFVEQELLFAGDGEEREHVAARERSDKRFFRIDELRVAEIRRGGGRVHLVAAVEFPGVIAVVGLVLEVGRGTLPRQRHFVFGHASV